MNREKIPNIERSRDRLLALEKTKKYVFHGSPDDLKILDPRQAYNYNEETKLQEVDGEPAVFATPSADVAIFRALTNFSDNIGDSNSKFGVKGKSLFFEVTPNILELAKKKIGKVYVLDKANFSKFKGMQCRNLNSVVPIEVIEVRSEDLPKNIKLIE